VATHVMRFAGTGPNDWIEHAQGYWKDTGVDVEVVRGSETRKVTERRLQSWKSDYNLVIRGRRRYCEVTTVYRFSSSHAEP